MANNSLTSVPYFFKGTYDQLTTALGSGGKFYPLSKAGYAFVTDRKCIAFCDTDGTITLIGDATETVVPQSGTVAEPVVLDTLPAGVYSISGTYQTTSTEPPISTSANQLFIISSDGTINQFSGETITKQVVSSTGTIVTEEYVTDADVIKSIASENDIKNLFN